MAHPFHHTVSSVKRWGGQPADYLPIHNFLDSSKALVADWRHRALYHHSAGIFLCEQLFGVTITNSDGREVPVRYIAEQHVLEDLKRIPAAAEWLMAIRPARWMAPPADLEALLATDPSVEALDLFAGATREI
jgi:hypothetical protein